MQIVSLGLVLKTDAESIHAEQAPLFYTYNLKGPGTLESEMITTTGTIKTISASCEFEGEVRLEVSANGGQAYTKIINGESLGSGFVPGNQLRFRANVGKESILKNITIGYTDSSGISKPFIDKDLTTFKHQKTIYLSGGNEELFNYPVKITIRKAKGSQKISGSTIKGPDIFLDETDGEENFDDIRFTSSDGQTPLHYYLEEAALRHSEESRFLDSSPSAQNDMSLSLRNDNLRVITNPAQEDEAITATFWVKIPQIPKEGIMLYLYYGNKGAVSLSNPAEVFPFFDDFNTSGLDSGKWLVRSELKQGYSLNDGYLQLRDCSIITRAFKMKEGILEFKAHAEKNAAIQAIVRGVDKTDALFPVEEMVYSSDYPGAEHTIAVNDVAKLNLGSPIKPMTEYIYKVIINREGIIFERYSRNYEKQAEIRFLDTYKFDRGYIGLKSNASFLEEASVYFDWVRVRPYTQVEPKAVIVNQK